MESNDKLKEIDVKKYRCHYFDGIVKIDDFSFSNVSIDENQAKTISFITFHIKVWLSLIK